jgi:exosortase
MKATADPVRTDAPDQLSVRTFPLPAVVTALVGLILVFWPILVRLVHQWATDEDVGHGFFVPLVAGYVAWQRRDELLERPWRRNYWGLALMVYAALQGAVGLAGVELFLSRTAFVLELVGMVLFAGGMPALKVMAFPLALLVFMVPIPAIVYSRITFPLQLFASSVAENVLSLIGIPVLREGNVLELASEKLNVVEACSGIRSLLSLSFLSLVYAHFFDRRSWMKAALLIATVPIAILANAGRVTATGILTEYQPALAKGFFHSAEGWVIFMVALVLLILAHRLIVRIVRFGEEVREMRASDARNAEAESK